MLNLSILVTFCLVIYYHLMVSREQSIIQSCTKLYGSYITSANVSYFLINGEDKLRWGLKLYIHERGLIIGDPLNHSLSIFIPSGYIRNLNINSETISFNFCLKASELPSRIEISCNLLKKDLYSLANFK